MNKVSSMKKSGIAWQHIDPDHYTITLLQDGLKAELIEEPVLSKIRTAILFLCQETILKYTHGDSTSVRKEIAEKILASVLYSLDMQLLTLADHKRALDYLMNEDIIDIYQKGFSLVTGCVEDAFILYKEVTNDRLAVDIYTYNTTIDDTLPNFLAFYDPVYNAHDIWASIDYPLLCDNGGGQGIFYIRRFLTNFKIENSICNLFDAQDIKILLRNFGRIYRVDYRETSFNILELVLNNAIFSVLAGNHAPDLNIASNQYKLLRECIRALDPSRILSSINKAIDTLLCELGIESSEIRAYIAKYADALLPRLISARENDNLANIILVNAEKDANPDILWREGPRLSDDDFIKMVHKILACANGTAKATIILNEIHSLGDFIDLLEADCLFESDFNDLFMTLGDSELSILIQIVFIEELRISEMVDWRKIIKSKRLEVPWQNEFANFLLDLDTKKMDAIKIRMPRYGGQNI
jgi:hypothetical protein